MSERRGIATTAALLAVSLAACLPAFPDAADAGDAAAEGDADADAASDVTSGEAAPDVAADADAAPDVTVDADAAPDAAPDATADADGGLDARGDADASTDAPAEALADANGPKDAGCGVDASADAGDASDSADASDAGFVSPPDTTGSTFVVFDEDFAKGVALRSFFGAMNDVVIDANVAHAGGRSLRIGDPAGGSYTGASMVALGSADVSKFNAVTFWAKADASGQFSKFGLGATDVSSEWSVRNAAPVTLSTSWQQLTLPLPDPSKAKALNGLFFFADGGNASIRTVWIDEVTYVTLPAGSGVDRPAITVSNSALSLRVGESAYAGPLVTLQYSVLGSPFDLVPDGTSLPWVVWSLGSPGVVSVDPDGLVTGRGTGTTALIPFLLGQHGAPVPITVSPGGNMAPTTAAPVPTASVASVVSIFNSSGVYVDAPVDSFFASYSVGTLVDPYVISCGAVCKEYTGLGYAVIEAATHPIDVSSTAYFHVDVFTPTITHVGVKLLDFSSNDGGVVRDPEVVVSVSDGRWTSIDIPLAAFPTATGTLCGGPCTGWNASAIGQIQLINRDSGTVGELFFDNMYFHR